MGIQKNEFLNEMNISIDIFEKADIVWDDLEYIYEDYVNIQQDRLADIKEDFLKKYMQEKKEQTGLQSYHGRCKDAKHLLEKIIRKRNGNYNKYKNLNRYNYMKFVTDTIGIRGLLLYREDWVKFHRYIIDNFVNNEALYIKDCINDFDTNDSHYYISEPPKVHTRLGDYIDIYKEWINSDNILSDKHYRSIHYILKFRGIYLEIQIRTLFEEGWGEIDHHILYPYKKDNEMLQEFSELLNRLVGMGDEMASFYNRLQVVSTEKFKPKIEGVILPSVKEREGYVNRVGEKNSIETGLDAINRVLEEG